LQLNQKSAGYFRLRVGRRILNTDATLGNVVDQNLLTKLVLRI